ncbi:MAG: 2-C-methyl-D-erythritol 4-phosphate cytidylyltransferase [Pseudopedobacter saltans]|uniref:2-C-methyl-D-erythritol 4-phosphate cytidylyltransferase n=1 Tax=Pseudopedobacter saltans TaxID=151895 RepID=A0A2W5FAK5_9SPHI|nr:MAG: 2-C-methyl-D-erythritol 4-phosphate cytidylyltransferase [Pseudopedobacter saltans]
MSSGKYAIIVAGGSGSRMESKVPKQFLLVNDKPLLFYTIKIFLDTYEDLKAIVLLPKDYLEQVASLFDGLDLSRIKWEEGGQTRFHSVKNGLKHVDKESIVFVHDGVRCMVSNSLIEKCYEAALQYGNAIPAVNATDSIRMEDSGINKSVDRNKIFIVQTPQTFQSNILIDAFNKEYDPLFTDEASVVESMNINIHLVTGEYQNIKVTRPIDLLIVEHLLQK